MANIRQVRNRIRSVKNIQQITRAMKMVASARLRRAQHELLEARPYAHKLRDMIRDIAVQASEQAHPLLQTHPSPKSALIVISSDKGLCGGFNSQPLQHAGRWLAEVGRENAEIIAVGRKAVDFFRRVGVKPYRDYAGFWQELNLHHADAMSQEVVDAFCAGRWAKVDMVYNRFKSLIAQQIVVDSLLPLKHPEDQEAACVLRGHEFEPSAAAVYSHLLPRAVKNAFWHALLESKAAELAARMQSMSNASDNAAEMIAELTLDMNRARQAAITREISELVGSAEAINA